MDIIYKKQFKVKKLGGSLMIPLTQPFREMNIKEGDGISVSVADSKPRKLVIQKV